MLPSRKAGNRHSPHSERVGTKKLTPCQISAHLASQRERDKLQRQESRARGAVKHFRPRKSDAGRIVMISIAGKRDPQKKGRKGFPVYITKTGKKRLIRDASQEQPYKPRRISEIDIPYRKNLSNAQKEFVKERRVLSRKGKLIVKESDSVNRGSKKSVTMGRTGRCVKKLTESLRKAFAGQASHRVFVLNVIVLCEKQDGFPFDNGQMEKTYEFHVDIARQDHQSIEEGGLKNFVTQKFYAAFARQLAFDGFVTVGSANHIRGLADNKGVDKEEWVRKDGQPWDGADKDLVRIISMDWKIEQAK